MMGDRRMVGADCERCDGVGVTDSAPFVAGPVIEVSCPVCGGTGTVPSPFAGDAFLRRALSEDGYDPPLEARR